MLEFSLGLIVAGLVIGAIWFGLRLRENGGGGPSDGGSGHSNMPRKQ